MHEHSALSPVVERSFVHIKSGGVGNVLRGARLRSETFVGVLCGGSDQIGIDKVILQKDVRAVQHKMRKNHCSGRGVIGW